MNPRIVVALTVVCCAGSSVVVRGQAPLTDDLVLAARLPNVFVEYSPVAACDDASVCALAWKAVEDPHSAVDYIGTVISATGEITVAPKELLTRPSDLNNPIVVGLKHGLAVEHDEFSQENLTLFPVLQYYDEELEPQGDPIPIPSVGSNYNGGIGMVRVADGFALLVNIIDQASFTPGIGVFYIDRSGEVTLSEQVLRLNGNAIEANSFAAQPDGSIVVVYYLAGTGRSDGVYLRRLSAAGLLGPEKRLGTARESHGQPSVAAMPDGSFMVVWRRAPRPETTGDILAQRFSRSGHPLGTTFQVNHVHQLDQQLPVIAVDSHRHYFVAWQSYDPGHLHTWDVKGRWFDSEGNPLTRELLLNRVRQFEQVFPALAASKAGTVIARWESAAVAQKRAEEYVPIARVFEIPP